LIPNEGIVQEWITSLDKISIRVRVLTGRFKISVVFRSRMDSEFSMKFSVSNMFKDEYS